MEYSDERIHLLHEYVKHVKLIKLYAWEPFFTQKIFTVRQLQNRYNWKMILVSTVTRFLGTVSPLLVSLATFAIYVGYFGYRLDAATVFTALMLFTTMKEPMSKLPEATNLLVKCAISSSRIEKFLCEPEKDESSADKQKTISETAMLDTRRLKSVMKDSKPVFVLRNVFAGWQKRPNGHSVIENISLTIPKGKLIFIVGNVGSGKTTLLHTLMNECFIHSGSLDRNVSDIAYCGQLPWIQEDTIRNNILFGEKFKLAHYLETIKSCALIRDLELLKDADWSLIGDRDGVQLSGGQR